MRRAAITPVALVALCASGWIACGQGDGVVVGHERPPSDSGVDTASLDARDEGSSLRKDAAASDARGDGGGADAGPTCSSDLTNVIGTDGTATPCGSGMLCAAGHCEAACQATQDERVPYGCDFLVTTPTTLEPQPCHVVRIHNISATPLTFTVTYQGNTLDVGPSTVVETGSSLSALPAQGIPPGYVGVVYLSGDPDADEVESGSSTEDANTTLSLDCPGPKLVAGPTNVPAKWEGDGGWPGYSVGPEPSVTATGTGSAFHIQTSVPAVVYSQLTYGVDEISYATASTIPPTGTFDTSYLGVSPQFVGSPNADWWYPVTWPNSVGVIAEEDGTTVTVTAQDDLPPGGGVAGIQHTRTGTFSLNAGQFIQWAGVFDLQGTTLTSNKPVGMLTGALNTGLQGTAGSFGQHCGFCDTFSAVEAEMGGGLVDQPLAPTRDWGTEYAVAPYPQMVADQFATYVLIASQPNTLLDFDPPLPGAPTEIGPTAASWILTPQPFRVKSQDRSHPFFLAQVDDGGWSSSSGSEGGAAFIPVLATDRYLNRIPLDGQDPIGEDWLTYFIAIRESTSLGFLPVTGPCSATIDESQWQPIGTEKRFEWATMVMFYGTPWTQFCSSLDGSALTSQSPLWVTEYHQVMNFGGSKEWLAWSRNYGPAGASRAVPATVSGGGPK